MKKILLVLSCFFSLQCFAQDSTKIKQQGYLGVLTLNKKYKEEKNWTAKEQAVVSEHFQRLLKMKEAGIVLLAGRTNYELNNPDMMGLIIFYAPDDASAQKFMSEDPAVKNNIMLAKVHPYSVAVNKCQ